MSTKPPANRADVPCFFIVFAPAGAEAVAKPPRDKRETGLPNGATSYSADTGALRRAALEEEEEDAEDDTEPSLPANGPLTLEQTLALLRRAARRAASESVPERVHSQQAAGQSATQPGPESAPAKQQPEGVTRPPLQPPTKPLGGAESAGPAARVKDDEPQGGHAGHGCTEVACCLVRGLLLLS